ncbi:MAG: hypothetical protein LBO74_10490 [Candidatus Symbiothrix sp.]|jgi:hypothetical protein|nr:hypothetical protein [Candidatus Symbiothrix sp.]
MTDFTKLKKQLENKSRSNRIFFDSLVVLIWLEVKKGNKRDYTWFNVMLPSYKGTQGRSRTKIQDYKSAIQILSTQEIRGIESAINQIGKCDSILEFREKSQIIFNDCMLCALNVLN